MFDAWLPKAPVIFGAVTIFGILSWYFIPAEKWLRREQVLHALEATEEEPYSSAVDGNRARDARYRVESTTGKLKDVDVD